MSEKYATSGHSTYAVAADKLSGPAFGFHVAQVEC
jgi:hypothetical protein